MESKEWNSLSVEQQLILVTSDICELLNEINSLISPGGELDDSINDALNSFTPLLETLHITQEDIETIDLSGTTNENTPSKKSDDALKGLKMTAEGGSSVPAVTTSENVTPRRSSGLKYAKHSPTSNENTPSKKSDDALKGVKMTAEGGSSVPAVTTSENVTPRRSSGLKYAKHSPTSNENTPSKKSDDALKGLKMTAEGGSSVPAVTTSENVTPRRSSRLKYAKHSPTSNENTPSKKSDDAAVTTSENVTPRRSSRLKYAKHSPRESTKSITEGTEMSNTFEGRNAVDSIYESLTHFVNLRNPYTSSEEEEQTDVV